MSKNKIPQNEYLFIKCNKIIKMDIPSFRHKNTIF